MLEDSVLIQSELTGGGRGLATVEMFTSDMMSNASYKVKGRLQRQRAVNGLTVAKTGMVRVGIQMYCSNMNIILPS